MCTGKYLKDADSLRDDERETIRWLTEDRRIKIEAIPSLPIGLLPPPDALNAFMSIPTQLDARRKNWLDGGPLSMPHGVAAPGDNTIGAKFGALMSTVFRSAIHMTSSLVFPYSYGHGDIGILRFRMPGREKKIVSTVDEQDGLSGLFGLGWGFYRDFFGPTSTTDSCYLVEGEFDALAIMQKFVLNEWPILPVFALGGSGAASSLDYYLKPCGFNRAYVIADTEGDVGRGDQVVLGILQGVKKTTLNVFVSWSEITEEGVKDPDDAVNHHNPEVSIRFRDLITNESSYTPMWKWAVTKALEAAQGTHPEDYQSLVSRIGDVGKFISSRIERVSFTKAVSAAYPQLPAGYIMQHMASAGQSEEGYVNDCVNALGEVFDPIATKGKSTGRAIIMRQKENNKTLNIMLDNTSSLTQEFGPPFGGIDEFIDSVVGRPAFISSPGAEVSDTDLATSSRPSMQQNVKKFGFFLTTALLRLSRDLPDYDYALRLRQGYHHIVDPSTHKEREYVVCGKNVVRLTREEGSDRPICRNLPGLNDGGIIFDLGLSPGDIPQQWYPGGITATTLDDAYDYDLKGLYETLVDIYATGFTFKCQRETTELLAGLVMTLPISSAFVRQPLIFITGDSNSGKSTLLSTFHSETPNTISLLHGPRYRTNYTAASVAIEGNRDSRTMLLDEFEFGDGKSITENQKIMELYRNLVNGEAVRTRARSDGSRYEHYIKHPVIFSAIAGAEKTQDLNRMLFIEMKHVSGKDAPATTINEKYSHKDISELAKKISIALIPHVPQIQKCYLEVQNSFHSLRSRSKVNLEYRYASSFFCILAFMKFLGIDWEAFFLRYVNSNEDRIVLASTISESDSVLDKMIFNSCIKDPLNANNTSIVRLLGDPSRRDEINTSSKGVYFDNATNSLLIHIEHAYNCLLPTDFRSRGFSSQQLRETLQRHRKRMSPALVGSSGLLDRAKRFIGYGISLTDVVAIDVEDRLGLNELRGRVGTTPMSAKEEVVDINEDEINSL
jgi:hypothetical protein